MHGCGVTKPKRPDQPRTPDGRYFVVRGRLWRCTNPSLPEVQRLHWVKALMAARRQVRQAQQQPEALREARRAVNAAKEALGERGDVWWTDGAPDYNRHLAVNTPYKEWFLSLSTGRLP